MTRICPKCGAEIMPIDPRVRKPKPLLLGTLKDFPAFWEEYPRKVAEKSAKRAWRKRHCDKIPDIIMESLAKQKDSGMFILTDKMRGCPLASTWLMKRRWEEDDKWKTVANE